MCDFLHPYALVEEFVSCPSLRITDTSIDLKLMFICVAKEYSIARNGKLGRTK